MATPLLDSAGVTVVAATCPTVTVTGAQEIVGRDCFEVVLVRAGCFQYRDGRGRAFVDATTCLLGPPQQVGEMSHPAPGGDAETMLFLCPDAFAAVGAGSDDVPISAHVGPAMQVEHRRLLAAARAGCDPLELEERALRLVAAALAHAEPARVQAGRPRTARARRQLAEDARALLAADPTVASVTELASRLACSPHHLSRVFTAHTGRTLGAYRTELRLNLALEQLADVDATGRSVADVATACGFADHAHLTRTLRRHADATPAALRAVLAGAGASAA